MPVQVPSEEQLREHLVRLQELRRVAASKADKARTKKSVGLLPHTADCVMIDMSMAWVQYLLGEPDKEAKGLHWFLPPV